MMLGEEGRTLRGGRETTTSPALPVYFKVMLGLAGADRDSVVAVSAEEGGRNAALSLRVRGDDGAGCNTRETGGRGGLPTADPLAGLKVKLPVVEGGNNSWSPEVDCRYVTHSFYS